MHLSSHQYRLTRPDGIVAAQPIRISLQAAASKNSELLDWLEALAYETKEFIEEDEKKELKEIHLKINEHKADFVWLLEEDSQLARKLQKNVGEFLKELG